MSSGICDCHGREPGYFTGCGERQESRLGVLTTNKCGTEGACIKLASEPILTGEI